MRSQKITRDEKLQIKSILKDYDKDMQIRQPGKYQNIDIIKKREAIIQCF